MPAVVAPSRPRLAYLIAIARLLATILCVVAVPLGSAADTQSNIGNEVTDVSEPGNSGAYNVSRSGRPLSCHDSQCNGHGKCLDDACDCIAHWTGTYCMTFIVDDDQQECPDLSCSGHGRCDVGLCRCDAGWSGAACNIQAVCDGYCNSPGGTCQDGFCVCNSGWGGATCADRVCVHQCWGHGTCDRGNCICAPGWEGDECEQRAGLATFRKTPWQIPELRNMVVPPAPVPSLGPSPGPAPGSDSIRLSSTPFAPGPSPGDESIKLAADDGWATASIFDYLPGSVGSAPVAGFLPGAGAKPFQTMPSTGFVPADAQKFPSSDGNENLVLVQERRSSQARPFVLTKQMLNSGITEHPRPPAAPVIHGISRQPEIARSVLSGGSAVATKWDGVAHSAIGQVKSALTAAERAIAAAGVLATAGASDKKFLRRPAAVSSAVSSGLLRALPATSATHNQIPSTLSGGVFAPPPAPPTTPKPPAIAIGKPVSGRGLCIEDCSGHGSCANQVCSCTGGWTGEACDIEPCMNGCNGRGACLQGSCVCNAAFYGLSCEYSRCLNDCSGHGLCLQGKCSCQGSWVGDSCDAELAVQTAPPSVAVVAPKPAHLREALSGFMGKLPKTCAENCNGNGKCETDSGTCSCFPGYTGNACQDFCPNLCSGQGKCTNGRCLCLAGFIGVDCSVAACCSGHGDCTIPGSCICNPGWIGDQCQMAMQCPDPTCSGHGSCGDGTCHCVAGFSGVTCATAPPECGPCPPGGECDRESGMCLCGGQPCAKNPVGAKKPGGGPGSSGGGGGGGPGLGGLPTLNVPMFGGGNKGGGGAKKNKKEQQIASAGSDGSPDMLPGASQMPDVAEGAGEQKVQTQKVEAVTLDFHPSCSAPNGAWNSTLELCECKARFYGDNCEHMHCADWNATLDNADCSGHGMCVKGQCFCAAGWGMSSAKGGVNVCEDPICPIDCGKHGICKENVCLCQDGWKGPACREPKCGGAVDGCSGHGTCTFLLANSPAECVCEYGFSPPYCSSVALYQKLFRCPNDCSGAGLCMDGKCLCQAGATGLDCSGHVCPPGTSGPNCQYLACPRDCMGYGMCFNGVCTCDKDHGGPDCSIPMKCYEACQEICLPDLAGKRCEFCKGQCLTILSNPVVGHHNPMLARLYSLADVGAEETNLSGQNQTVVRTPPERSRKPHRWASPWAAHSSRDGPTVLRRRQRRKRKEVSAVQTAYHKPRTHHKEVSAVKIGRYLAL